MAGEKADGVSHGLFQQAVEHFMQRRYAEASAILVQAVAGGDAEAQNLLGVMHLNGMGVGQDSRRAAELFAAAAEAGLKEGHYNLSNLLYNGLGAGRDAVRAQGQLLASARLGHRAALRSLGYLYHLAGPEESWQRLATLCFRLAAEAGDPLAQYNLGLRLVQGHGAGRDTAAALRWFSAAAQARVYLAAARLTETQRLTPVTARPLAEDGGVDDLVPFPQESVTAVPASRSVVFMSEHPQALDPYLCDHLINAATPQLAPSGVVHPETGLSMRSDVRTSYSMYFQPNMYDAVVAETLRRLAAIGGLPAENAEPIGVLRYGVGQEYRPHFDFYDDPQHKAQRVSTVFIYLNDVEQGGGTEFPRLGVTVQPERAKAVKFLNCDAAGKPNPETLHAGLPVVRGEKWLATLWFWDRPYQWSA